MRRDLKAALYVSTSVLAVFLIGFLLSSHVSAASLSRLAEGVTSRIRDWFYYHAFTFQIDARHYFLLPEGGYVKELYTAPWPISTYLIIFVNALFNTMFQPLFFCVFTPQVVLNYILFPFFLYGAVKHFKKVPIMILVFLGISFYVGTYGSVVEALIRHRLSCELVYLLIGLAGFTSWITES